MRFKARPRGTLAFFKHLTLTKKGAYDEALITSSSGMSPRTDENETNAPNPAQCGLVAGEWLIGCHADAVSPTGGAR